jgi:hypothetical protein
MRPVPPFYFRAGVHVQAPLSVGLSMDLRCTYGKARKGYIIVSIKLGNINGKPPTPHKDQEFQTILAQAQWGAMELELFI